MNRQILIVAASLFIAPLGAAAQSQVSGSGAASATAATGRTGGEAALQATASMGLPTAQVESAVAEGRARGASRASIDRAALAAQARLEASRRSLSEEGRRAPSSAEIEAGASAMAAGATSGELVVVREAAPRNRSLVISLETLASLRAGGEGSDVAGEIAALLRAGATDEAVQSRSEGRASGATKGATRSGAASDVTATADAAVRIGSGLDAGLGVAGSLGAGLLP